MATGDLFNESWYLRNNPDIAAVVEAGVIDAFTHFQLYGRFEGRSPDPAFDPGYYLESNPDIAAAVQAGIITAYDHFVSYGANEARSFVPYFDPVFYLQSNPDIAAAVEQGLISVVDHFLLYGQGESRAISPFFDLGAYLQANPDVANADGGAGGALEHLLLYGFAEGRDLGNGVSLAQFQDDPVFQQALESSGNPFDALARVAEVAPFLPSFQPPAGWTPPADTPIPVDFVPVEGEKMVIPPSVVVPDDVELPDTFEPVEPTPEPEPGPGPGPTFGVHISDAGNVTFSGTATGAISMSEGVDGTLTFTRGAITASSHPALDDVETITVGANVTLRATQELISKIGHIKLPDTGKLLVETSFAPLTADNVPLKSANVANVSVAGDFGPLATWENISVVGNDIVDKFKLFWVTGDEQYYGFLYPGGEPAFAQSKAVNDANLELGVIYLQHLDGGGLPVLDVVQTKRSGEPGFDVRQQSLHDNLLANLNVSAMNSRISSDVLTDPEFAPDSLEAMFSLRPNYDGVLSKTEAREASIVWDLAHDVPRTEGDMEHLEGKAFIIRGTDSSDSIVQNANIAEAVTKTLDDDTIYIRPGNHQEEVVLDAVAADVDFKITGLGDDSPVIDGSDGAYAIRATGAGFQGTVTIEGLTILTGSQGGIGQYMSASAGTFHVLSNTVGPSEGSFAVHGNAIQISGAGSTVIGNDVTVAEYTSDITNWSTSGITVVKDASNARIEGNTVRGPEGIEDGNSVIGIAVDAKYTDAEEGMSEISILDNEVTNLTAGISLSDRVDAEVSGNVVTGNLTGIRLGSTQAGWNDELNLDIVGNTFSANDRAIAISDFDGGGTIAIKGNTFDADEMTGAIWLNAAGEYAEDTTIEIDLLQFTTEEGLADNVVYSNTLEDESNALPDFMLVSDLEDGLYQVTWSEGVFNDLTIILTGAADFGIDEIYDFFGAAVPVV